MPQPKPNKKDLSHPPSSPRPHLLTVWISGAALAISCLSLWESHEARVLNYASALPSISATVELLEPIQVTKRLTLRYYWRTLGRPLRERWNPPLLARTPAALNAFLRAVWNLASCMLACEMR